MCIIHSEQVKKKKTNYKKKKKKKKERRKNGDNVSKYWLRKTILPPRSLRFTTILLAIFLNKSKIFPPSPQKRERKKTVGEKKKEEKFQPRKQFRYYLRGEWFSAVWRELTNKWKRGKSEKNKTWKVVCSSERRKNERRAKKKGKRKKERDRERIESRINENACENIRYSNRGRNRHRKKKRMNPMF